MKNVIFVVETKKERVTMESPGQDKRSVFEPSRVEIERRDGTVVATRDDPEASFQGQDQFRPWDDLDVTVKRNAAGKAQHLVVNHPATQFGDALRARDGREIRRRSLAKYFISNPITCPKR